MTESAVALRNFIREQGMTQREFAEKMGCSQGTISLYLNGKRFSLPQNVLIAFVQEYDLKAFSKVFLRPKGE